MKYIFLHLVNNDADSSYALLPVYENTKAGLAMLPNILREAEFATLRLPFPWEPSPKITLELPLPDAIAFDMYEEAAGKIGLDYETIGRIENASVVDIPHTVEQIHAYKNQATWYGYLSDQRLSLEHNGTCVFQATSNDGDLLVESIDFNLADLIAAL